MRKGKTIASGVILVCLLAVLLMITVARGPQVPKNNNSSYQPGYPAEGTEAALQPTPEPTPAPTPNPYASGIDLMGKHFNADVSVMDLTGITDVKDVETFCAAAPYLDHLRTVELGSEASSPVSWATIQKLQEAAPNVDFRYAFSLYGEPMTLDTDYIDLRKIHVNDNGQAVMNALPCMKRATYLDMDQCGVDSDHMVIIRDAFPNVKVVWRVEFSTLGYSARTDVKTILASLVGEGDYTGITNDESAVPLTYCTDLINLDVGHNNNMRTLSFLRYMPNLEVFITYNNYLRNVDDLVYCPKLRYLELFGNSMYNIKAIGELYELTDLQLGGCYNLEDISPIVPADKVPNLRRLWLTPGEIPKAQIDEFKKNHPNCIVNDTDDSVGYYWRFVDPDNTLTLVTYQPEYILIRDLFHYGAENQGSYNFSRNDPYVTTAHGQPITDEKADWFYGDHHYENPNA